MNPAETTVAQPARCSYGDAHGNAHAIERLFVAAANSVEPTETGSPAGEVSDAIVKLVEEIDEEGVEKSEFWAFRRCRAVALVLWTAIMDSRSRSARVR